MRRAILTASVMLAVAVVVPSATAARHHHMNGPVVASYYTIDGTGACGVGSVQSGYRFASLILPCGARVQMCNRARCVSAVMSDHGPYVGGRTFDLNANLRSALGCGGLCYVTWRRL